MSSYDRGGASGGASLLASSFPRAAPSSVSASSFLDAHSSNFGAANNNNALFGLSHAASPAAGGNSNGNGVSNTEAERLRQDAAQARREAAKVREAHEADRVRWESEASTLRATVGSLQASVDALTAQRLRDTRERADTVRGTEDIRAENARLRKELSQALDSRLSHLRVPAVSFEQYREVLAVAEHLASLLRLGGGGGGSANNGSADAADSHGVLSLAQAREWVQRMQSAPFGGGGGQPPPASSLDTPGGGQLALIPHPHQTADGNAAGTGGPAAGVPPLALGGASFASGYGPATARASSVTGDGASQPLTTRDGATAAAAGNAIARTPGASPGPHGPATDTLGAIREVVVEGGRLVKIVREAVPPAGPGKEWSFHNATPDTQFVVEFTFGVLSDVAPLGDTEREGRTFRLSLYPGETKPFVVGLVNGYKMAVRYGPPDEGFVPPCAVTDSEVAPLVERVRTLAAAVAQQQAGGDGSLPPDAAAAAAGHAPLDAAGVAALLQACVQRGVRFVDVQFPPLSASIRRRPVAPTTAATDASTLGGGAAVSTSGIPANAVALSTLQWLPPSQFLPAGQREEYGALAVSPASLVGDSHLGFQDEWLLAALAAAADDPDVIHRAFSRSSAGEAAHGCVRVWLNTGGLWHLLALDHCLPCSDAAQPVGLRCRTIRDLWASVLQKAFAKCHGSFQDLAGPGDPLEALSDLTGCPSERLDWKARDSTLFGALQRAAARRPNIVLLTAVSRPPPVTAFHGDAAEHTRLLAAAQRVEYVGLAPGRAYRVLAVVACEGFRLVLVRNGWPPADPARQWAGAWSPQSEMWARHTATRVACEAAARDWAISDGSAALWFEWRDACHFFEAAGVCFVRPQWFDVRVPLRFFSAKPSFMVEITVMQPVTLFLGLHQPDRRGLDANDPNRTYGAFLLTVVGANSQGVWDAVAQSHDGAFWRGRDVHVEVTLQPNSRAYYVLPRRFSADGVKDVVFSLMADRRDAVKLVFRQPSDAVMVSVKYSPVWKFDPSPCEEVSSECQVDREIEDTQRL